MRIGDGPITPEPGPGGRRILILDFDLYGQVGGGQSVYRRIIEQRPQDVWFYFRRGEAADAPRPANACGIPFIAPLVALPRKVPEHLHDYLWVWHQARNMALSVSEALGRIDFDVVDAPDYAQLGPFIRPALAIERCRVGTVAVAMHGTLSDAFRGGWSPADDPAYFAALEAREDLQFRAADARYAISDSYAEAWQARAPLPVNRLDPLVIAGLPDPRPAPAGTAPPDLLFVGRREKWKGPDLFIDLAWCLPEDAYGRLLLLGPEGPGRRGELSAPLLLEAARRRGLDQRLEMPGSMPAGDLRGLFAGRSLLLLPSRHDTFNLTALEAIGQGCPALVSNRAGVARWLRERLPALDWAVLDVDCSRSAASATEAVLRDYDRHRDALLGVLRAAGLRADLGSLGGIHDRAEVIDELAQEEAIEIAEQLADAVMDDRGSLRRRVIDAQDATRQAVGASARVVLRPVLGVARRAGRILPDGMKAEAGAIRRRLGIVARTPGLRGKAGAATKAMGALLRTQGGFDEKGFGQARLMPHLAPLVAGLRAMPETTTSEIEEKLRLLTRAVNTHLVDRVLLFREMARLERRAGAPLTAATYLLRTMRWLGTDTRGDLPFVVRTLREHNFTHEAAAAQAMFGAAPDGLQRSLALMQDAYGRNLTKPVLPLAVLDDRRGDAQPRACVIASLYNAADKLPTLLGMLSRQTLAMQGGLEVVLVDSNSPADEHGAFEAFAAAHPGLPIVYARSAERETIQAAWNRGIRLARAPYLAFLGADEGLHPDALRILAETLDREPATDWAMADSIVTNVDRAGIYDGDIMTYDRRGYRQDLVYLETCYLSWVGALYRRSIHDRFGYYDESYRAAGDTEFKNRVMPHIRSTHVKLPLGVFNNYPEERTTQHPRAEIEDLRAWYLWRTPAGMDYAFGRRPAGDAVALLRDCFAYRKSFCGHLSTDYDLAVSLSDHLMRRPDRPDFAAAAWQETRRAVRLIQELESLPSELIAPEAGLGARLYGLAQLREAQVMARRQRDRLGLAEVPRFDVFNDNRYEQHWWSWSVG